MTHADLLVQVISELGRVPEEEARFLFESFRASFPGPEHLDRKLSETEADVMIRLYRENRPLLEWVTEKMTQHHENLPSA